MTAISTLSAPITFNPPRLPAGWIAMDPFKTDSILGIRYGMRKAPIEKKPPPSMTRPGRIHPNPYPATSHPAHAARAKWIENYESGKITFVKRIIVDPFRTPIRRGLQLGSPNSANGPAGTRFLGGPPLHDAPLPETPPMGRFPYRPEGGYTFVTPPRSRAPEGEVVLGGGVVSELSPLAEPFVPGLRGGRRRVSRVGTVDGDLSPSQRIASPF